LLAADQGDQRLQRILYSGAAAGDADFQSLFPEATLHTTDIRQSERVDILWDLEQDPPAHCLGAFDLFISTSVLEHVQRLWLAAANMERTLKPGGCLYISVPWVWEFHAFPSDDWRLSLPALDVLFTGSTSTAAAWSTYPDGALYPYAPAFDQQLMASQESTTPEGGASRRRLLPLLLLHTLRPVLLRDALAQRWGTASGRRTPARCTARQD
jgi:SAM-dependent methyltransferase